MQVFWDAKIKYKVTQKKQKGQEAETGMMWKQEAGE